ncbi:hypothetical protein BE17_19955 [Sorangium cellulosum]|uniref:Uncharacterized protein n=1 Tax=Sorangium cellulosum TaxID=56 RepID=A0A150SLW9_SORCE|nr:hypothetical protein BE17_19955 [Sorangium cellulosum]
MSPACVSGAIMSPTTTKSAAVAGRRVPVDWIALANAFDNIARGVRHFIHLDTGAVLRLNDGLVDPATRARVEEDPGCLLIEPIAARDQYRWLEAFIPTVDDLELRLALLHCMQGQGTFRRFKAALSERPEQLHRWRVFRIEQIRATILRWFHDRGLTPVPLEHSGPSARGAELQSSRAVDSARQQLYATASRLAPRDLQALTSLAEFLRAARSGLRTPADSSVRDAARAFGLVP